MEGTVPSCPPEKALAYEKRRQEIMDRKEGILKEYHLTMDPLSIRERENTALEFMCDYIDNWRTDTKEFYFWRNVRAYWARVLEMVIRKSEIDHPIVLEFTEPTDVMICDPIQCDILRSEIIDVLDESVGMSLVGKDFAVFGTIVNEYNAMVCQGSDRVFRGSLFFDGGIMGVLAMNSDAVDIDSKKSKKFRKTRCEDWFILKKFVGKVTISRHTYTDGSDYRTIELKGNEDYTIQELINVHNEEDNDQNGSDQTTAK